MPTNTQFLNENTENMLNVTTNGNHNNNNNNNLMIDHSRRRVTRSSIAIDPNTLQAKTNNNTQIYNANVTFCLDSQTDLYKVSVSNYDACFLVFQSF